MTLPEFEDSKYFKNYLAQGNSARLINVYVNFTLPHIKKILENTEFYIEYDEKEKNYKFVLETITFDDLKYHKIQENSKNSTNAVVKNDILGYLKCEKNKQADNGKKFEATLLEKYELMLSYALETFNKKSEIYLTSNEFFLMCGNVALNGEKNLKISYSDSKSKSLGE